MNVRMHTTWVLTRVEIKKIEALFRELSRYRLFRACRSPKCRKSLMQNAFLPRFTLVVFPYSVGFENTSRRSDPRILGHETLSKREQLRTEV